MRTPEQELAELEAASLRRRLRTIGSPQLPHCLIDGEACLSFASNDYLGLANHPAVIAAQQEAAARWGAGSGSSRLICGGQTPHEQLEETIARAKHCQAALTFANGYATSVGTLTALLRKGDTVIIDKLAHASLIDGARLSGATIRVFPHNDLQKLKKLLVSSTNGSDADARILVVTESVFSMDGDLAALPEIIALKNQYGALLLCDEAHALGIYGATGMGLAEELGCSAGIDLHMGTLGKAAGVAGGYIAASRSFIDLLINRARSFIYSTSPPPAQAYSAHAALQIITSAEGQELRQQLWQRIKQFSELTHTPCPQSAIIPWHIGDASRALAAANFLRQHSGILVPAIRYPTVARNAARLRITLTAAHSEEDICRLVHALTTADY